MGKKLNKSKKISTKQCAVSSCSNTTNVSNVTFHNFPGIKAVRDKWKIFCGIDYSDYLCKKYLLCSAHFAPECFDSIGKPQHSNSNAILKELAIPTIKTNPFNVKLNCFDKNQEIFEPIPQNVSRCRICLATRNDLENIFGVEKLNHASKIEQCVQIDIKENDNLPQKICIDCIQLLENAYKFKILCEQSNKTLKLELIDRIRQVNNEISSNFVENQTNSIKDELDLKQNDEVESNYHSLYNGNEGRKNDKADSISNALIDKNVDLSEEEIDTKYEGNLEDSDNSGDSDWINSGKRVSPRTIPEKKSVTKELKIKAPKIKKKRKHSVRPKIQCDECGFITAGPINLEDHKRAVHQGIIDFYKCHQCPKAFKRRFLLYCHLNVVHKISPVVCDLCGKSFKNKTLMGNHRKIHTTEKKYKCDDCPYMTSCNTIMKKHKSIHTGERKYQCHICESVFRLHGALMTHVKAVHHKIQPHKCEICGKSFSDKSKLRKHGVIHTGFKPYPCPLCPNVNYSWYAVLVAHQRALHPDLKLQTESVLYKTFMRDNNLSK